LLIDFAVGVVLSAIVSMAACRVLIAAGLWDLPTLARKLHEHPTPTAGGIGVGVGVGIGLLALTMLPLSEWRADLGPNELRRLAWCAGAAYGFLLIGFIDDTFALGPRAKLAVFVVASVGAVLAAGVAETLPIGAGIEINFGFWIGLAGSWTALTAFPWVRPRSASRRLARHRSRRAPQTRQCWPSVARARSPAFWCGIFRRGACSPAIPARCSRARSPRSRR
jgi:UDP-N-acetylmuramyl pentapeptide phosphotransferase/UDP-N-acetylglucosamine-1-phosphate transferase